MKDYSVQVTKIQEQLCSALQDVKIVLAPRKWDGAPFNASMVPIAVIHLTWRDQHIDSIVSKIVSDNHVTMMSRRDGNLNVIKILVYIQRKQDDLV